MAAPKGQTYRRLGLMIEVVCMLGLLSVARGNTGFWIGVGLDPSLVLACGLALGFAFWAFGTYLILKDRQTKRGSKRYDLDL